MPRLSHTPWRRSTLLTGVFLVLMFVGFYVVIPHFRDFGTTYQLLRRARIEYVVLALVAALFTYPAAALCYQYLAIKRLRFRSTLVVQFAGSFANRVFPAGAGALAFNYRYLRAQKHSSTQAGLIVVVNNLLGFASAIALCAAAGFFASDIDFHHLKFQPVSGRNIFIIIMLLVLTSSVALVGWHWKKHVIIREFRRQKLSLNYYGRQPRAIMKAFIAALGVSGLYVLALLWSASALGVELSVAQAVLAMALTTFGSVIVPTPGGVGGAEAALTASLMVMDISSASALAVALLYRLFTFWLPIVCGGLALRTALRYL